MSASAVYKGSWFKNANLILVGRGYLSRVCAAIQATDPYVVVHGTGYDLDPLEIVGKDDDVAASRISLETMEH